MNKESTPTGILDKLVPVLLLASIVLAFIVGMLWQRVSNLQGGGGSGTANTGSQGTNNGSGVSTSPIADLPALVESIGIDRKKFESCFDEGKYKEKVEEIYQGGIAAGVSGTPANFIVNSKGEVWFVPGAFPFANVKTTIDIALGKDDAGTLPQGVEKYGSEDAKKVPVVSGSDHIRGNLSAPIKFIEYSDYQCPYCKQFHPVVNQVLSEYGDDVALVYRHFPLDSIHPLARPSAEASECVFELGGNDAFWKFTDAAFAK